MRFPLCQAQITLTPVDADVYAPVGVGYQPGSPSFLVLSLNYPTGSPFNFARLSTNAALTQFGPVSQIEGEVHLSTVRTAYAGFQAGDVFCGSQEPGVIVRITANGTVYGNWCVLRTVNYVEPGAVWCTAIDETPTRVFGGDLIAVTEQGGVWRVNSSGVPIFICQVKQAGTPVPLESCITIPNDTGTYGTVLAGKILAGSDQGGVEGLYAIGGNGTYQRLQTFLGGEAVNLAVEDADLIPASQNLFVAVHSASAVWTAPASQFTSMTGDILVTVEGLVPSVPAQLYRLRWSGSQYVLSLQWSDYVQVEHSVFAPMTITAPTPVVTVTMIDPLATEEPSQSDVAVYAIKRTGATINPLTVNFSVSGTASRGTDYRLYSFGVEITGNSVQIPANSDHVQIILWALTDGVRDPNETAVVALSPGTGYTVGSPSSATASIGDANGGEPTVVVVASDDEADETGYDGGVYTVYRSGTAGSNLAVNYTLGGTAGLSIDYTLSPGPPPYSITIPAWQTSVELVLMPTADGVPEGPETAVVTLASGSGYLIGAASSATVTIYDPPVVTVTASFPTASEDGARLGQFTLTRTGQLSRRLLVFYELPLPPGTAQYGADYVVQPASSTGSVLFDVGQAQATVLVQPLQDTRDEGPETVVLALVPGTDYVIGSPSAATVTIEDNDTVALPVSYTAIPIRYSTWPSYGYGINSLNQACGNGAAPPYGYWRAFRWVNGTLTFLSTWSPYDTSTGYGINDSGVVVGQLITTSNYQLPVKWVGTSMTVLDNLENSYYGAAVAIANNGVIVGSSRKLNGVWHAVRWNAGGVAVTDLGTLSSDPNLVTSYAYGINIAGRVVGKSQLWQGSVFHAFRTKGAQLSIAETDDLGTGVGWSGASEATAINLLDEVVGATDTASGQYRAFWKSVFTEPGEGFLDLGVLPGGNRSIALGINNVGHIVGRSRTSPTGSDRAFICYNNFNGSTQTMRNLNDLLSNPAGWVLYSAEEINDAGWIVGYGTYYGTPTTFVLAPNF